MSPDLVIDLGRQALWVVAMLVGPILISALLTGLAIGMFQAATSINEMTLSFIPKLIVMVVVLSLVGTWMLDIIVGFTREIILAIPDLITRE